MNETRPLLSRLVERFPEAVISTHSFRGDDTAFVRKGAILEVLRFLKETPDLSFEILMDLTAVDYLKYPPGEAPGIASLSPQDSPRFNVIYHLYSLTHNHRIRVKAPVEEDDPTLPSCTSLWPIANWLEREVWDMFGIKFVGHPDLRRLLMFDQFEGHPLRKDYPLRKRQPLVPAREDAPDETKALANPMGYAALNVAKRKGK
jgi:NADH-quinone oxidoreductase subunit C